MAAPGSMFTAAPAAIGYLYQARLALAVCLRYAYSDAGVEVAIERLDDVSFEANGSPLELLQTKHHIRRVANLSDSCPDLWRRCGSGASRLWQIPGPPTRTQLVLKSRRARLGPIMQHGSFDPVALRASFEVKTRVRPRKFSLSSPKIPKNQALAACLHSVSCASPPPMRSSLLSAVRILHGQPLLDELGSVIEGSIRMAAPRGQVGRAREMLEGWWWPRICDALMQTPVGTISVLELEAKLRDPGEALNWDALIADFEHATPPEEAGRCLQRLWVRPPASNTWYWRQPRRKRQNGITTVLFRNGHSGAASTWCSTVRFPVSKLP